ncbi:MipA/OmpV family protein [Zhongshania sp.]|uniref:MipA/OmpV family protein n=1 Tax=Zhongshania sp. TaxID=1971902 RepID=UPI003562C174
MKIITMMGLLSALFSFAAEAEALRTGLLPKWELGAGIAGFHLPDYPGAEQSSSYVLPFPYIIYRGERVKADREGVRGLLFEHRHWDLNISAGGSLPVNSGENRARDGMDDLDFSFEFGPSLRLKLQESAKQKTHLRFNVRALLDLDGFPSMNYEGWVFNPELRWQRQLTDELSWGARVQVRYGSKDYHDYFYGVAPQFARSDRHAYRAPAGYNSTGSDIRIRWEAPSGWRVVMALSYVDLHDASFNDSPLFKKNSGAYFSLSIARILWRSNRRVVADPIE